MTKSENEFSIKIVGSGTKKQILKELKSCLLAIEANDLSQLQSGIEREYPALMLTTDDFDAY